MSFAGELSTLVFDWGGTLMLEDPRFPGTTSMADWPEVKAIDGVHEALSSLGGKFHLVLASNAAGSDANLARQALKRVGLDGYFSKIFTSLELKARKPDTLFFRRVEDELDLRPHQLLYVGDDFWGDMVGASQAGWKAIWYNPKLQACPGLYPLHQGELANMADLPAALERTALPDPQTCYLWCLEQGFSYNLWLHVRLVAAIAYQLAVWLRKKGETVDPILAHRGGLLHDLAKLTAKKIKTSASHAEVAASLLRERGQPELAEIARRHIINTITETENAPRTWEEKLVYFADKLAEGERLVEVEERLEALQNRHRVRAAQIEQARLPLLALKGQIAAAAGKEPADLGHHLSNSLNGAVE